MAFLTWQLRAHKVSPEEWASTISPKAVATVRIDRRYAEIQGREIAEARLERLEFYALHRCYDGRTVASNRNCEPVPNSKEPEYQLPG